MTGLGGGGVQLPSWPAKVAKLVDALDLGSSGATCESSSLSFRTNWLRASIISYRTYHYFRGYPCECLLNPCPPLNAV